MQLEQAVDADKENLPALHEEHVLADIAPVAGEKDPAAHSSHVAGCTAPSVGEKVPAAHSWHADHSAQFETRKKLKRFSQREVLTQASTQKEKFFKTFQS